MPNQTLSALTSASSLTGTELFYIVQGGADRKLTTAQLSSYIGSPFTPSALGIFDDINVLLSHVGLSSIAVNTPLTITAGWQGTLSSARLNANVVQTVTNDTNVTGLISSQNLTLGWTGTLPSSRGGTGAALLGATGNLVYISSGVLTAMTGSSWVDATQALTLSSGSVIVSSMRFNSAVASYLSAGFGGL